MTEPAPSAPGQAAVDQAAVGQAQDQQASEPWRRVSPAAILHYVIHFGTSLVTQGWQGLLPALGILTFRSRYIAAILLALIGAILVVAALLSYLRFRYRVQASRFLVDRGVIIRKRLTIQFDRIQSVDIHQPFYFRPFRLAILKIESAGSTGEEASIAGISLDIAKMLREQVLAYQQGVQQSARSIPSAQAEGADDQRLAEGMSTATGSAVLHQANLWSVMKFGLSSNAIWVVAGLLATGVGGIREETWFKLVPPVVQDYYSAAFGAGVLTAASTLIATAAVIFLILVIFSIIGAVFRYAGFRLLRRGDRLVQIAGLIDRHENGLREGKIQALSFHQNAIARLLGVTHMRIVQPAVAQGGGQQPQLQSGFTVPSLTRRQVSRLCATLMDGVAFYRMPRRRIAKRYIARHAILSVGAPALLPCLSTAYFISPYFLLALLLPVAAVPVLYLRWRRYRFGFTSRFGFYQSGFIGTSRTVFALHKVQAVSLTRSPGQRAHGLADLQICLAGKTLTIPYMPVSEARRYRDQILAIVETSKAPWI